MNTETASRPYSSEKARAIAIVSGKGGSGKTMVAATLARLLDSQGTSVLLIDADFGTAGLTYYMGLTEVSNISIGLTRLLEQDGPRPLHNIAQPLRSFRNGLFIGVGDHRRYLKSRERSPEHLTRVFREVLSEYLSEDRVIIVDCRGGIDEDSLAVCAAVDTILIVAETDTTSFQSTQHLVDVLYDGHLSDRLGGFFINKVFDDPATVARNGTSAFKTQYLSSIPFDIDATRSFLIGDIPELGTLFARQLWCGAFKALPTIAEEPWFRPLGFEDFRGLTIRDRESGIGGVILAFAAVSIGSLLIFAQYSSLNILSQEVLIAALACIAIAASTEPARRLAGRVLRLYTDLFARAFGVRRGRR